MWSNLLRAQTLKTHVTMWCLLQSRRKNEMLSVLQNLLQVIVLGFYCIALVFLLLHLAPAWVYCPPEELSILHWREIFTGLRQSTDFLSGLISWCGCLWLYYVTRQFVMCGIVLAGNVFIVFTVVLYFIMRLYCVFYCRTSLKTNFPQGAIKFAIELKQGHKNTRCISNRVSVCGGKYLQQSFTGILNIKSVLWFTLTSAALDLLKFYSLLHLPIFIFWHT